MQNINLARVIDIYGPFYVLRNAFIGGLYFTAYGGHGQRLLIGKALRIAFGVFYGFFYGAEAFFGIENHFFFFRRYFHSVYADNAGFFAYKLVRVELAGYEAFAEAVRGADEHFVVDAGYGVDGEGYAGNGAVYHFLNYHGDFYFALRNIFHGAVCHGAVRVAGGPAAGYGFEYFGAGFSEKKAVKLTGV
ncbi:MAG: hypothetical protein BWY32_02532 [bacterium ADurb.Bin243]|nr:MAG: hypothetical protein BWY32_02532 [bacterium ADurb.Bin243]